MNTQEIDNEEMENNDEEGHNFGIVHYDEIQKKRDSTK